MWLRGMGFSRRSCDGVRRALGFVLSPRIARSARMSIAFWVSDSSRDTRRQRAPAPSDATAALSGRDVTASRIAWRLLRLGGSLRRSACRRHRRCSPTLWHVGNSRGSGVCCGGSPRLGRDVGRVPDGPPNRLGCAAREATEGWLVPGRLLRPSGRQLVRLPRQTQVDLAADLLPPARTRYPTAGSSARVTPGRERRQGAGVGVDWDLSPAPWAMPAGVGLLLDGARAAAAD